MKAFLLCAGLGTRLGALGKTMPKCLLEVGGKTLLERIIERLKAAAVDEITLNLHHLPDIVRAFVEKRKNFGLKVNFSFEPEILGTGGGLKHASKFFSGSEPFFMHNGDVLSDVPLDKLLAEHKRSKATATLAMLQRDDSRHLLFDGSGALVGWENVDEGKLRTASSAQVSSKMAFTGIQVLSPDIFKAMSSQSGFFSIIDTYLLCAKAGMRVQAFDATGQNWIDVGTPQRLEEARRIFK